MKTMGPVNGPTGRLEPQRDSEELQRALEGELVGFLRQQNSKLMDESAYLRSKLDGDRMERLLLVWKHHHGQR